MLAIGLSLCFAAVARAVSPTCGELYGTPANLNAGISLSEITTIVAFGDGFTSGGTTDGSPLPPPVQEPPNPRAGGRVANGPVWVEYLADSIGATLRDFAVPGSVIDNTQYPQLKGTLDPRDFLTQANKVITLRQKPDPDSTLYVLYLGMEDYKIKDRVSPFDTLAGSVIYESLKLASSPLFAKNILFVDSYALGDRTADGESYLEQLFSGISALHDHPKVDLNVGFVDFSEFFAGLKSDVQAAGFDELGPCTVSANTTEGQCSNPDKVVYYIEDYPSTETHKLMSEFAQTALETCISS